MADEPKTTYTDEDVTAACGLHLDNLRRLITWGAVAPAQWGGGRGRVRKWTGRQAMRISVAAQFVEAGFSLQMSHTLMQCLPPLNDFLDLYDPRAISASLTQPRGGGDQRLRAIISPAAPAADEYRAISDSYSGKVFIVDRRFLYAKLLDDDPELYAIIDLRLQRVIPRYGPYDIHPSMIYRDTWDDSNANRVLPSSLLIEDDFLYEHGEPGSDIVQKSRKHFELFREQMPAGVDWEIRRLDRLVYKNLCVIDLSVGLILFVRNLLGLPSTYPPEEKED
jgi:hypothetical protein